MDLPDVVKKAKMPWMTGEILFFILGLSVMGTVFFLNLRSTESEVVDLKEDFNTFLEEEFEPFESGEDKRFHELKEEITRRLNNIRDRHKEEIDHLKDEVSRMHEDQIRTDELLKAYKELGFFELEN